MLDKCADFSISRYTNYLNTFFGIFLEISSNFDLEFPSSSMTDYALLYRVFNNLTAISLGFWMKTSDNGGNYGTVISYANDEHANAFTMMDYTG